MLRLELQHSGRSPARHSGFTDATAGRPYKYRASHPAMAGPQRPTISHKSCHLSMGSSGQLPFAIILSSGLV